MLPKNALINTSHLLGEVTQQSVAGQNDPIAVQLPGGTYQVRVDPDIQVSSFGGMVPFAQFLNVSGLWSSWVEECPLVRTSPNASSNKRILGTWVVAVTTGQSRYAHITGVRGDTVTPEILGFEKLASEDTVRRFMGALVGHSIHLADKDEEARDRAKAVEDAARWSKKHLVASVLPLFDQDWILDMDVTIKPLYGFQEGSVVGYNPHKPGRPSHAIHSFLCARYRLIVGAEVHPGDEHTAASTKLDLTKILDQIPRDKWPKLLRGDCAFGTENMMSWPEEHGIHYLFKVRMTKYTKELIQRLDMSDQGWLPAGQEWQGKESKLQLSTWTRPRRVVVLRRPYTQRYPRKKDLEKAKTPQQEVLAEVAPFLVDKDFEYQVIVTSLDLPLEAIAQLYRDRSDAENIFDELKNQWGWGGFTSHSFEVSQLAVRMVAIIYNWWSIFVRLVSPKHHREAITSRPALLHSIARKTTSGGQTFLTITSTHDLKDIISRGIEKIATLFRQTSKLAEQLSISELWPQIVRTIFQPIRGHPTT